MKINVQDRVEIYSEEDGFLGSYYLAKVLEIVGPTRGNKKRYFVVEYETLLDNEDPEKPLREKVEDYRVRPLPTEIGVCGFDVLDKVDAYDNEGWWVGRITGMYQGNIYSVYFDSSGDEYLYPFDKLRVHQEFDDGVWNTPLHKGYEMVPF